MLVKKQKQSDSFTPLRRLRLKSKRFYLKGFTVLELLIVIAIIGIITSVLLVAFKGAMERARIAQGWQFSDSLRGALQMDMVAWWPLDRIVDGKTPDSWFDRLDGTVYGATSTEGIVNGALSFNGSSDYVEVPDSDSLDITGAITIEVWVYPTAPDLTYYRPIVAKYYTAEKRAYQINVDEGYSTYLGQGTFQFWISSDGTTRDHVEALVSSNQWQHVTVVYSGSNMLIYVNGRLKDSKATTIGSIYITDIPLRIGTNYNATRYFNGLIDEVRLYNTALPQATIQQHYAEGLKRHQDFAKK